MHKISNRQIDLMIGDCAECGPGVGLKWHNKGPGQRSAVCRLARNRRMAKAPSAKRHAENRRQPHGLTVAEAREYLKGKTCAACGTDKDLVVDHCHKTGKRRGALCRTHNRALGLFQDNLAYLISTVEYLKNHDHTG